jgi:hypothetical protein
MCDHHLAISRRTLWRIVIMHFGGQLCLNSSPQRASDIQLRQDGNEEHTTLHATFERSARFVEDVRARRAGQRALAAASLRDP